MENVLRQIRQNRAQMAKMEFKSISLEEGIVIQYAEDSSGGVAGCMWESCQILLKHCQALHATDPNTFVNKIVVELGAGTGVAGMLLALYGAKVIVTDLEENVGLLRTNLERNASLFQNNPFQPKAMTHAWGDDVSPLGGPVDIIIAADCIYNLKYSEKLLHSILSLCHAQSIVYFPYTVRNPLDEDAWFTEIVRKHFEVEVLAVHEISAVHTHEAFTIWRRKEQ